MISDEGKRYDRFRGRVMFPIRNPRGQVIGFGARVLETGEPKYLNSPETPVFRKGHELYGLHEARDAIRKSGRAIVAEGYMDVIRLAQAGFDESVAALGTAVTSAHVGALFKAADHVIFAFRWRRCRTQGSAPRAGSGVAGDRRHQARQLCVATRRPGPGQLDRRKRRDGL